MNSNWARNNGGGIYIFEHNSSVRNLELDGNVASYGGGLFVKSDIKKNRNLRGKSVVRDNKGGNFILAEGNRINVNLTRKSEVHMDYVRNPNAFVRVTPDNEQSPNCTQYLKSDAVYHFTYNNRKEQRQRVRAGAHCAARLRRRGRVGERLCAGRYGRRGGGRLCRGG